MKYALMDYVSEAGWTQIPQAEQKEWLGAYRAYMEAMSKAGILRESLGLRPSASATTVRTTNGKSQLLDGPYADSKEQLGGLHVIEVADLDAALSWACLLYTSPSPRD